MNGLLPASRAVDRKRGEDRKHSSIRAAGGGTVRWDCDLPAAGDRRGDTEAVHLEAIGVYERVVEVDPQQLPKRWRPERDPGRPAGARAARDRWIDVKRSPDLHSATWHDHR